MSSRKAAYGEMSFEFQRVEESKVVRNQYELTMQKPFGLDIEEVDGYVTVTAIKEGAPKLLQYAVKVGDRIVAVDSSLGDSMWPVSTVEGVISACTSRLPGQQVTMRFERPQELMEDVDSEQATVVKTLPIATTENVQQGLSPEKRDLLLQRSRDLLQRYLPGRQYRNNDQFTGKFSVPAIVADKIVDAVASASTSLDCVTLSMLMTAYLSCQQPEKAMQLFEAAVGVNADGSVDEGKPIHGAEKGTMVANPEAMNAYTASSLLCAHAMTNNLSAVKRVLCALEGKAGIFLDDKETAVWIGTRATGGTIVASTACYNVALSAVAKAGKERLLDLMVLFDGMAGQRNLISYNTVISALADAGRTQDAFGVFTSMKQAKLEPDKFTYTALVKVCQESTEMASILSDMRKRKIEPDVVTYNTMIKTLCRQGLWFDATELIREMESASVKPNSITYGYLMTGLAKAKKYSTCLALFETACADARTMTITESVHLYTTAISAASALGNHEKAFDLVSRMQVAGVKPNQKTMTALLSACMTSGKPDMAVDIYRKIENPDGVAMSKGLEAMCHLGLFQEVMTTLKEQRKRRSEMSGKQVMMTYNHLMGEALLKDDFETGRAVLNQILSVGNIPSKVLLQTVVQSLDLVPPKKSNLPFAKEIPEERFDFLLFVIDSLTKRNVAIDPTFYIATVRAGARMDSLRRKLVSLMVEARALMEENDCKFLKDRVAVCTAPTEPLTWETLLYKYDDVKAQISDGEIQLPFLVVQLGKQMRQVLLAEQAVTYSGSARKERKRSKVFA